MFYSGIASKPKIILIAFTVSTLLTNTQHIIHLRFSASVGVF